MNLKGVYRISLSHFDKQGKETALTVLLTDEEARRSFLVTPLEDTFAEMIERVGRFEQEDAQRVARNNAAASAADQG